MAEHRFGHRHAGSIGDPLPEQPGSDLDATLGMPLGMAFGAGPELAEPLELFERELRVAGQVQQRVEQHRTMPGREHETVAVEPERIGRIEF